MQLQIIEVILWPRSGGLPRRLRFETGMVNVITGASRTGKSAVIPIIDYCLGSGSCSIPVDTIRDSCSWFGVLVATNQGQILLARREPGLQRATDDMMIVRAPVIEFIPDSAIKNTTVQAIKQLFDELAGLTNLESNPYSEGNAFEGRPSFRDMAAFNFQPQNVVANPDVLFYKTSTYKHREKLRSIFPYILGAVTPELLAKQHELARLRGELRRKQRELETARTVSAKWEADIRTHFSEAREFGLVEGDAAVDVARSRMIEILTDLTLRTNPVPQVTVGTIRGALEELRLLEQEEVELSQKLTTLRRRLGEMQRAQDSVTAYGEARTIQIERLQISSWMIEQPIQNKQCPMCGSEMNDISETLRELSEAARVLEDSAGIGTEVPAAFDRELNRVSTVVSQVAESLQAVQQRKQALVQRSNQLQSEQYRVRSIERFLGSVSNALVLQKTIGQDGLLSVEVEDLSAREASLAQELRQANIDNRKRRALEQIDLLGGRLLPDLDTEFPNAPMHLDIDDLTIHVSRQNRNDVLSEIGSGSNWLSYHLASMLALHQFFLSQPHSPVPSFLVLDQPSQVYFPKRLVSRSDDPDDEKLRDEDVEAVQKAFRVLASVVSVLNDKLQIIVLDHVSENVWGEIPEVHKVEEWRDGRKLVPVGWLS